MRKILFLNLILSVCFFACNQATKNQTESVQKTEKIKVGIFDTNGDNPGCIVDAFESLRIDKEIEPSIIGASTIMSKEIMDYDVILFPGGSGRAETNKLGKLGFNRVKELVTEHGKGVIGICAGSYILTQTEGYPSLDLSGFKAIDIEHDHRGHGLVKFSLTPEGKDIFPELKEMEICFSKYYEGPVLTTPEKPLFEGKSLATMLSDVHIVEGTPSNMTNNRPFITATETGKGKTATFVGHPENTPGMRWMIPRMVRWASNKELISYTPSSVRPQIYDKEILFTSDLSKEQNECYEKLWGTEEEKIESINKLIKMSSWSAKKWIIGLIRDESPRVRVTAAKGITELERTEAIPDIKEAIASETDPNVKKTLEESLSKLKAILGS